MQRFKIITRIETNPESEAMDLKISFEYHLPDNYEKIGDPFLGRLKIFKVTDIKNCPISFRLLPLYPHVLIIKACWDYMERNQLFKPTNVIPIY
ncbi:hypothetical protein [Legionella spiritensis]|uniref:Uncharacterized protein n=1 Tax=Legionella spiritensis TaxID=452 RepID=A0A0W0Z5Q8_LEGSP|nr:hypothetical protein [Legionella spiritensis]KTD64492.1 hypothetical protein Lspi_1299 [Legionella spiritensis]SNV45552.1 Uncharacterised protein [Legionella spiritensis]